MYGREWSEEPVVEDAVTAAAAQQQVDQEAYQKAADSVVAAQQAVLDLLIEVINVVESAE